MTDPAINDQTITWETLNAYVDGELDASAAANVASAIASDRSLADRVATLARLKASVACRSNEAMETPPLPTTREKARRLSYAAAAAVLLLVGAGLVGSQLLQRSAAPAGLEDALLAQRQWIASAARISADESHQMILAASLANRPLDLTAAELQIVYAVPAGASSGRGNFLGYRGPHGCMVGFWMGAPSDRFPANPIAFDNREIEVRAWRRGDNGYAILSSGMDPARLDRLAEIVAGITDPGRPPDDNIRVALRDASRIGAACRV